ncbi:HAD family hydrolase [Humibacter ginsenosidimutans]|uniref:HAD-IA family hydrolase n=1 Tax=Humibacter ginsenosidimutans TaxID=2599293 RepID=A0A5B8M289_9MICO|nr:HAD-IA family hydrolase [Humibacter ginsenosidimutans]QDZ13790.1 HAD-IA family hydrolase [Humibacter ginsenosidimutans]
MNDPLPDRTRTMVLWDFDGTIAERPGHWSSCMLDALEPVWPQHGHTVDSLELFLRTGFPWQDTTVDRRHLTEPDAWWAAIDQVVRAAYLRAGVPEQVVDPAVAGVRPRFRDPATWRVIPEARDAISRLSAAGVRQAVLSNHVPELEQIVRALGLSDHFERVFTSAAIGWEKPHPGIFEHALRELGRPGDVWLIGDNPVADVQGATAAGIHAVLVEGSYLDNGGITHADAVGVVLAGRTDGARAAATR